MMLKKVGGQKIGKQRCKYRFGSLSNLNSQTVLTLFDTVVSQMRSSESTALAFIRGQLLINPNRRIDIVGHSRGGYVAMEVARNLQTVGINGKPVDVRFLGLYDPVDMAPGYGIAETVPSNVKTAAVIYAAGRATEVGVGGLFLNVGPTTLIIEERSRGLFNRADDRADGGPVSNKTDFDQIWIFATHSAIGGAAWNGDSPAGHGDINDRVKAVESDKFVRNKAISTKLPINVVGDEDDYGYEWLGDAKETPRE